MDLSTTNYTFLSKLISLPIALMSSFNDVCNCIKIDVEPRNIMDVILGESEIRPVLYSEISSLAPSLSLLLKKVALQLVVRSDW